MIYEKAKYNIFKASCYHIERQPKISKWIIEKDTTLCTIFNSMQWIRKAAA